jgi:rod shape determining protein RodA
MILFAAVANLGANLTILPVTGIPLPFISYGRTSLLTNLAALGIVQSVLLYRLKYRY